MGTIVRDATAANTYSELYGLKVTPAAINDGVQYNLPMYLPQGRTYRLRGRAKGAAAEILSPFWYDGTTDQAMTAVSGATLSTTWTPFEFTFTTTTKSTIANIKIKDSKASPAVFYLDDLMLIDDTTATNPVYGFNPMDHGMAVIPFEWNIVARRVVDGVIIYKVMDCTVDKLDIKAGKAYTEDISFQALDVVYE
jgi:Carbohydrate binding domain